MYKFLFRTDAQIARLDNSIIIKDFDGKTHHLVEADFGVVGDELGVSEKEAIDITTVVLKSIFRVGIWKEVDEEFNSQYFPKNYSVSNYQYNIGRCPGYEGYIPSNLGHEVCGHCGSIEYYH